MVLDEQQESQLERTEARAAKRAKDEQERTATVLGVSPSDLILSTVVEQANKTQRAHEQLELSARDSRVFVEALICPPAPTEALCAARRRHTAEVER